MPRLDFSTAQFRFRFIKIFKECLALFLLNWTSISEHKSLHLDLPSSCVVSVDMKCSQKIEIKYILFMTKDLSSLKLHTELYVSSKRDLIPLCILVPVSPDH